ncbi:MAG: hypothetical protein KDC38_00160 [Planctomycetes bacterium]|nr:hypothetical protein [Planctomycetota bacterium]
MIDREQIARFRSAPDLGLRFLLGVLLAIVWPKLLPAEPTPTQTRLLSGAIIALTLLVYLGDRRKQEGWWWSSCFAYVAVIFVASGAIVRGDPRWLLWIPSGGYLAVGSVFAWSIVRPPSVIERAAFWIQPRAPEFIRPYCRVTTGIWAVALIAIGSSAVALSVTTTFAETRQLLRWTPLGLGALALVEVVFRKIWFRHYKDGWVDRAFARFFPAERTERGRRSQAYLREIYGPK